MFWCLFGYRSNISCNRMTTTITVTMMTMTTMFLLFWIVISIVSSFLDTILFQRRSILSTDVMTPIYTAFSCVGSYFFLFACARNGCTLPSQTSAPIPTWLRRRRRWHHRIGSTNASPWSRGSASTWPPQQRKRPARPPPVARSLGPLRTCASGDGKMGGFSENEAQNLRLSIWLMINDA